MIFTHMKVSGLNILSYSFPLLLLLSFFATSTIGSILHVHSFSQSFYSEGQVPQTYDLELRFNSPQLPPYHYLDGTELKMARDQNTAVLFPFTYHDQILNKLKLRFENLIDVERVLSYSVQDDAMLVIPEDVLDSKFFTIQAQKINFVSGVFTESIEGINEKNFSPCRVVSYPESQLREIASICNLDSSSLEQLLLGNGVLLISPSLKIEEEFEDGGILYSRTSEGENLLSDPHLKEYETMKLYLPQAKQQLYGFISQDELVEKQATFHAIDVNILGNTTKNIAWFDVLNERPLPYRIVVADNFWKNNKLKQDISRLHIFYKNHVNTEDLATTIRNMSADIPNLVIKDQHYNIETWHEYQIVEKWFLTISTIFFVLTLIIFSISICRAFILHNERNFILYRDLGLSRRRIISICLLRFFPFAILSLLILLVLSEFVWINIIDGWFLFSTLARVAFIFFTVLIYFICYSISALIECSSLMNSKTYSE